MPVLDPIIEKIYPSFHKIASLFRDQKQIDFFCGNIVDYICFRNIHQKMPEIRIVARNRKVKKDLADFGVESVLYPTFPDIILMARHLARKYPCKNIVKIGMRHGAYHFKDFVDIKKYNAFDKFCFTSPTEVLEAKERGITNGVFAGFPKLDLYFQNKELFQTKEDEKILNNLTDDKKVILFSATWDKKGYSSVDKWYDKLSSLTAKYQVLITLHPWVSKEKIEVIKNTENVIYLETKNVLPYLARADLMISDTSSIIAEFCALDKPIITFEVEATGRITENTISLLEAISYRVKEFKELESILEKALLEPNVHQENRKKYNEIMFGKLDGRAGDRVVKQVKEYL